MKVVEIVNEKIIEKLENGVNPWVKPWVTSGGCALNRPMNYISNKAYSGINVALLEPGYYLTFKQISELGGNVKKGAKSHIVVFSKTVNYKDKEEQPDGTVKETENKGFVLNYYRVFALEDTEGCREIKNREEQKEYGYFETATAEEIDQIVVDYCKRTNLKLEQIEQSSAYYQPIIDKVTLPLTKQFKSTNEYYSTLFHELGHSTGHSSRLNRGLDKELAFKGSQSYSKEELIAEITATYCMNHLNLETDETISNSASYLKGWAEHLRGNTANWFIINATTSAEKAYKMILNISC